MAGRLEGKIALVTGGGSGIGRACCVRFAQEGAAVCAVDMNLEGAAETVRRVEASGGKATALQVDTTDEAVNERMVQDCISAFGAVDVLVAAAGIGSGRPPTEEQPAQPYTVLTMPVDWFKRVIDVNFWGV
ncbi:MAG TPA: SDR family NAD(P)-dependent oxidoreductase, partial [Dehalococcoidia bacterium]